MDARAELVAQQADAKDAWAKYFMGWYYTHYALGIAAVILSTLVAAKPVHWGGSTYPILAWLLAVLTGLIALLKPDERGNRYRRAWSLLKQRIDSLPCQRQLHRRSRSGSLQPGRGHHPSDRSRAAQRSAKLIAAGAWRA